MSLSDYEISNRIGKGHSVIDLPEDYTVIDLETTGLSPRCDEIIELAAVKVRNRVVVDSFQQLVRPEGVISDFISSLTGITNEMVAEAPSASTVLSRYFDFIGTDLVVGHNVSFDVNFLFDYSAFLYDTPFKNDYVNTIRIAKQLVTMPHYRLCDLCSYFDICIDNAHRALADCQMTYRVVECLRKLLHDSGRCVAELVCAKRHCERRVYRHVDARMISSQVPVNEIDTGNPIFGRRVVFTGVLERFTRIEAMQLVANLGGINQNGVTKETDYLVLGNNDYCKAITDGKSSKQKKAEEYVLRGTGISIMDEKTFYDIIESDCD